MLRLTGTTHPPAVDSPSVPQDTALQALPKSDSQPFSPTQRSTAFTSKGSSPGQTDPRGVPTDALPSTPPPRQSLQPHQETSRGPLSPRSPASSSRVQQTPEVGIVGNAASTMQRGRSLNVLPPVGRTAGGLKGNWGAFWEAVMRDHCHAGLIWNEGTRAELREALQVGWQVVCTGL